MGAALVVAIFSVLILAWFSIQKDAGDRDALYVAPYVKDGKVVPGQFVDPDDVEENDEGDQETPP